MNGNYYTLKVGSKQGVYEQGGVMKFLCNCPENAQALVDILNNDSRGIVFGQNKEEDLEHEELEEEERV